MGCCPAPSSPGWETRAKLDEMPERTCHSILRVNNFTERGVIT